MEGAQLESIDPGVVAEVEADLRAQLDGVHEQMRTLTRKHQRAVLLKRIYGGDPLTRERFNVLTTNIDEYPGKMAELREEEQLLTRWLHRCLEIRAAQQGPPPFPSPQGGGKPA